MEKFKEGEVFRSFLGMICVLSGLAGIVGLYIISIPPGNKDVLVLALGIVLGWGSAVVQSEYGATTTGRKVADTAIKGFERQTIANELATETPTGTAADPISVAGATDAPPVDVINAEKK